MDDDDIEETDDELKVTWTKARIIPTRQGIVTQVIKESPLTGVLAMVHKNAPKVEIEPAADENAPAEDVLVEAEPEQPRLVFGETRIEITKRKKVRKTSSAQMSLF